MNCKICGQPVVLIPSAKERALKSGGTPADYIALFPDHAQCVLDKRKEETNALMRRLTSTTHKTS